MPPHPNRPGGVRGPDGAHLGQTNSILSQILAAIEDLTAAQNAGNNQQATLIAAIGTPDDTECGNTLLQSLCGILGELVGPPPGPGPSEPPYRCGDVFQGGYVMGPATVSSLGSRLDAPNAWYVDWSGDADGPSAYWESVDLEGDGSAFPTLYPGILPRTVCISAYVGTAPQFIGVDRYNAADQTYHDSAILGPIDFDTPWTAGTTFNVDPDYVYRFYAVMAEGDTAPPDGLFIFYTEGGLG